MNDLFDPFGMGSGSGVGSSVSSSRQASGPDLFGDLLGSDSSATSGFSSAHSNPTPASNTSLFNLSKSMFFLFVPVVGGPRHHLQSLILNHYGILRTWNSIECCS